MRPVGTARSGAGTERVQISRREESQKAAVPPEGERGAKQEATHATHDRRDQSLPDEQNKAEVLCELQHKGRVR